MNARRLIIISVLLNFGLLAVAAMVFRSSPLTPVVEAKSTAAPSNTVQKVTRTREVQEPDQVIGLNWQKVESPDYKTYITNLRAVGCPEETIRDIVIADINKLYAARWRQMNPIREYKYWRHGRSSADDPTREANARKKALDALLREKRQLVRDLLGVDLAEDGERYADSSFRGSSTDLDGFDFLTPERRQVLRDIRDKYESQFQQIYDNRDPDNFLSPELRKQMADLRKQADQEMEQALTPAELEQLRLRFSGTAQGLRNDLAGFEPTEEEFRRLYAMRRAVEEQFENANPQDQAVRQQRADATAKMDEEIKAFMSPERYADYKLSQDRNYKSALSFTRAWDLPKETALAVYGIQQAVEKQLQDTPEDQRKTVGASLRADVEKPLRDALGERAFDSYRRSQRWFRGLGQ